MAQINSENLLQYSSFVFQVGKFLRTNRFEVICQESLLPRSHCYRRHEPQFGYRRGGKGDSQEDGNRLKSVRRLMKDPLNWAILCIYIPAENAFN